MNSYGYIRVSSEEQLKGDGIDRQRRKILSYISDANLTLTHTFVDEGVSAYSGANINAGELGKFITAVESGIYATPCNLLVENSDRLSRDDPDEAQFNTLRLTRAGVIIHILGKSGSAPRILKKGMSTVDMIMSALDQDRSNQESAHKQARLLDAWECKRAAAVKSGKPMTSLTPAWIDLKDGMFSLNKERAELILTFLEQYKDDVGFATIAKLLNAKGVETWGKGKKKGRRWYDSYIKKIFENRALFGEYQPHRAIKDRFGKRKQHVEGEPIADYFPALITKDEFDDLQALKLSRRVKVGRKDGTSKGVPCNLFSGLLFARELIDGVATELKCTWSNKGRKRTSGGSRIAPKVQGKGYAIYYSPKHPRLGTRLNNYEYSMTEKTVLAALAELKDEDLIVTPSIEVDPAEIEEMQLLQQQEQFKEQLGNFLDVIAKGSAPSSIIERITDLEAQIKKIDAKLPIVRARKRLPEVGVDQLPRNLAELKKLAQGFDPANLKAREVLRDAIAKIVKKVVVSKHEDSMTKGLFIMGMLESEKMIEVVDPVIKRKAPLYVYITFVGGARRAIITGLAQKKGALISTRVEKINDL